MSKMRPIFLIHQFYNKSTRKELEEFEKKSPIEKAKLIGITLEELNEAIETIERGWDDDIF